VQNLIKRGSERRLPRVTKRLHNILAPVYPIVKVGVENKAETRFLRRPVLTVKPNELDCVVYQRIALTWFDFVQRWDHRHTMSWSKFEQHLRGMATVFAWIAVIDAEDKLCKESARHFFSGREIMDFDHSASALWHLAAAHLVIQTASTEDFVWSEMTLEGARKCARELKSLSDQEVDLAILRCFHVHAKKYNRLWRDESAR